MKHSLRLTLGLMVVGAALGGYVRAGEPGRVDFDKFTAAAKREYVDVTLGKGVLKLAGVVARCKNPQAAEIIAGLTSVRVNVVGLDDSNRHDTTDRIAALRANLARDGWDQIVTARGRKQEDVAIFVKQRDGEVIDGVVVTVVDERKQEAVFVNVVGQIKPESLAALGEQLQIPQLSGPKPEKAEKS